MSITKLPVLVLSPYTRCNCRCTMCDIWKSTEAREMSVEDIERQLPDIEHLGVEWVVLTGGEALMHSDLWKVIDRLRRRPIRITLLSSGLLLERFAREITKSIDDVIVSLDGPPRIHNAIRGVNSAFERLAAGVTRIRSIAPAFTISARCTVQRSNFLHLSETVSAARACGLNSISFLAADVDSQAFHRSTAWPLQKKQSVAIPCEEVADLDLSIEGLIASGECGGFIRESPQKLRRIARHFHALLGNVTPEAPLCNAPWTCAVVETDGTVRPCYFQAPIGRIDPSHSLESVLNGPVATAFRQSLNVASNPICQKCVCSLNWKASA